MMTLTNRIYLAAPFFSPDQKKRIAQVLAALKANASVGSVFVPHEHEYTAAKVGSFEWQAQTFKLDTNQIDHADAVVAIVDYKLEEGDNEADAGTMFEVGYAYATNTPVMLVQFDEKKEVNLMLTQSITAYFDASKDGLTQLQAYDFNELMPKRCDRDVI